MVPPYFPHLVLVPALLIDLLHWRAEAQGSARFGWRQVPLTAFVFAASFIAVQWHFSRFLLSPAAENAVFVGNKSWPYTMVVGEGSRQYWGRSDLFTSTAILRLSVVTLLSTAGGAWFGAGLKKIIR